MPEMVVLLDVWKCAKCLRHELPVVKNFGEIVGEVTLCPHCGSEDIFPLDDDGWPKNNDDTIPRGPRGND